MKRLFFLVPDLETARAISLELDQIGIHEEKIHIVGGAPEIYYEPHLHMASISQTSRLVPALKRGFFGGLVLAVLIFVLFYFTLPASVTFTPVALVAMLFFGIAFGIWVSGFIGISVKDPIVEKYEDYVKDGHIIMMVDSPNSRQEELKQEVMGHHPEAKIASD